MMEHINGGVARVNSPPTNSLIKVGILVSISEETFPVGPNKEGGTGRVIDYNGDGTFDVKYVIGNRVEKNVRIGRVASLNPLNV